MKPLQARLHLALHRFLVFINDSSNIIRNAAVFCDSFSPSNLEKNKPEVSE
jgi:hypothetical protein